MTRIHQLLVGLLTCVAVSTVSADNLRKDFNDCREAAPEARLECYEDVSVDSLLVIDGSSDAAFDASIEEMKTSMNKWEFDSLHLAAKTIGIEHSYTEMTMEMGIEKQRIALDGLTAGQAISAGNVVLDSHQTFATDLTVYDVSAKPDGEGGAIVDFKVKNNGKRMFSSAKITVFFKDESSNVIFEEEFDTREYRYPSIELKPNYIWAKRQRRKLSTSRVPSEWNKGAVDTEVTGVTIDFKPR